MSAHVDTLSDKLDAFSLELGIKIDEAQPNFCRVVLPYKPKICTAGGVIHGGAIATLIDTAGVLAAWSKASRQVTRGATASLSVSYLSAAHSTDLIAEGTVMRRGRRLVFVDVDVRSADAGRIAKGIVTYKFGYENTKRPNN